MTRFKIGAGFWDDKKRPKPWGAWDQRDGGHVGVRRSENYSRPVWPSKRGEL